MNTYLITETIQQVPNNYVYRYPNVNYPDINNVTGRNNGTWGIGMRFAGIVPPNMNGPIGSVFRPLPLNVDLPTGEVLEKKPYYNSPLMNTPAYNESSFVGISGTQFLPIGQKSFLRS